MTEDELIREIQLKKRLSELDGTPAPGYDPSDGMETVDELKRYVRFLCASVQEKEQENLLLRKDLSEIKEELKAANRRADVEADGRRRLFERLERFMDGQKSSDEERKRLLRKIETLENRLALANRALYGGSKTCNDKYSGKKSEGINDGRDDFDGTMQSLPEGTPGPAGKTEGPETGKTARKKSGPDGCTGDAAQEDPSQPSCYHGPSRKGCSYVKEVIGEPIPHQCVVPEGCKVIKEKKPRKVRTLVQRLEEHHFQRLLIECPDGTRKTITATLLSFMIFNRYIMAAPTYRESKNRCPDMDWHICRQNRSIKGAKNSGIFNTFISTCKQKGRNFRDFLVDYVKEYNKGNRDFGDLVRLAFAPSSN